MNQEAEARVEAARRDNSTVVDLSELRMRELPPSLADLVGVVDLDLSGNQLKELPEWLGELSCLTRLVLRRNQLTETPASLGNLAQLTTLDLGENRLSTVPPWLSRLTGLTILDLYSNHLTRVPDWLGELTALVRLRLDQNHLDCLPESLANVRSLSRLDLDHNDFTDLPACLRHLTNLTELYLGGNQLTELPDWMANLTGLTELWLGGNQLTELPDWMANLTGLTTLRLNNNELTELPGWMADLTGLTELWLGGNPLTELPDWIANLTGLTELYLGGNLLTELPDWMANLTNLTTLYLGGNLLTELPDRMANLTGLTKLTLGGNQLTELPGWMANLTGLTELWLGGNPLTELPDWMANLTGLTTLHLRDNQLTKLPDWIANLTNLTELYLGGNLLTELPDWMANLTNLTTLYLGGNLLTELPDWMANLTNLTMLRLGSNPLIELPDWMANLTNLTELHLSRNQLTELPDWMANLTGLTELHLGGNQLTELPDWMANLTGLTELHLSGNQLTVLPDWIGNLTCLTSLDLDGNELAGLPFALADLQLRSLGLAGNPLAPELQAAYQDSTDELVRFLRLLRDDGVFVREAKLVLVGEGAVGKSSLLAALRGEEWVEQRSTTHGIDVKPLRVTADVSIVLNGWDFGGQPVYRPTHQLFFTAPAVYLVVWKPREGPEQGFVDYWIKLIKHRAGDAARVHVVATHGGPLQRSAYIDEAALRDRYGDMIVGFHHVDSRTGLNIDALRAAIADTAAALPHIGRWYPESWQRLRAELRETGEPYLSYPAYEAAAIAQGLGATSARSLAKNAHALGHCIHSADEPGLADLVIFKADWLATAISLVLDDPATIAANGLLPHRLLPGIWNNPGHDKTLRYPSTVHHVFVQLMEKFDISYRVTDGSDRLEPTSLVAQLVRTGRPDLTTAWHDYGSDLEERTLICEITESATDVPAIPEGLMYQLIVRFHRYSLGRADHRASVHWQHGVVLDANHHGRALITMERNRVAVTVRAAYPQFLLHQLTEDIREHVHSFWKGLDTRIKVSCHDTCPSQRGLGLFDIEKLIASRQRGRPEYPCPACDEWQEIDGLLLGARRATTADERLTHAIKAAIEPGFTNMIAVIENQTRVGLGALDQLATDIQRAISQAEEHLRDLIITFDDEAREGPRLFTLRPVESTPLRPGWTKQRVRLTLWCEHSRIPLHMLNLNGRTGPAGVYDIDVPREWLVKAAPWINAVSVVVRSLLPVSMAAIKLDVSDEQWANIGEQLELAEKTLDSLAGAADAIMPVSDETGDTPTTTPSAPRARPEGSLLRTVHAILKDRDPSYAGLERVRDRNRYLWVHPRFANVYRSTVPIPPIQAT